MPVCPVDRWHALHAAFEGFPDLSQDSQTARSERLHGHTMLESTVRHLGIGVDDALNMAEQIEL